MPSEQELIFPQKQFIHYSNFQRMPIKKKIFWTDLGLARKIYRNQAIYDNATNVTHGVRRMGRRVSLFVQNPFGNNSTNQNHDTSSDNDMGGNGRRQGRNSRISYISNNSNRTNNSYDVPQGSEDAATNDVARPLSTVLEERKSGASEATKTSAP